MQDSSWASDRCTGKERLISRPSKRSACMGFGKASLQPNIAYTPVILITQLLCSPRQPVVCTNPQKGEDFYSSLIQMMPGVKGSQASVHQGALGSLQTFLLKPQTVDKHALSISENDCYQTVQLTSIKHNVRAHNFILWAGNTEMLFEMKWRNRQMMGMKWKWWKDNVKWNYRQLWRTAELRQFMQAGAQSEDASNKMTSHVNCTTYLSTGNMSRLVAVSKKKFSVLNWKKKNSFTATPAGPAITNAAENDPADVPPALTLQLQRPMTRHRVQGQHWSAARYRLRWAALQVLKSTWWFTSITSQDSSSPSLITYYISVLYTKSQSSLINS